MMQTVCALIAGITYCVDAPEGSTVTFTQQPPAYSYQVNRPEVTWYEGMPVPYYEPPRYDEHHHHHHRRDRDRRRHDGAPQSRWIVR